MFILVAYANQTRGVPTVAIPLIILLIVMGIRFFQIIAWTGGKPGCLDIFFTLSFVSAVTAFLCWLCVVGLMEINHYSPALAWLAVTVLILMIVFIYRANKVSEAKQREKDRHWHENWEARHKNDLCRYCDAYKTGDGEIHHTPSCRG